MDLVIFMKTITLHFNDITVTTTSNDNGFFNLNEIARGFGLRLPSQWRNAQRTAMELNANLHLGSGGTGRELFANEVGLYAYAAWADNSQRFFLAVFECFKAAANGDGDGAVAVASEVVQVREGLRQGNADLCNTMTDHYSVIQTKANEYSQFAASVHRMVHKLATNKRMPIKLRKRSVRDELVRAGDAVALTRMTTLYGMYSALAEDGYEYQRIKAKLEAYVDKKQWFTKRIK